MERLNNMMKKRTETFLTLCDQYRPDLGFIVYRATAYIQYLAMSEIESLLTTGKCFSESWSKSLNEHYTKLDGVIKTLLDQLSPDHLFLVSDHGAVPYKYHGNADDFLIRHKYMRAKAHVLRTALKLPKQLAKKILGRTDWNLPLRSMISWQKDFDGSKAFGHWYVSGIFINDKNRFNGPVEDAEYDNLVNDICRVFNNTPEASKYHMEAKPYRKQYADKEYSDYLPDIEILCPDSIFFAGGSRVLIEKNTNYGPVRDLTKLSSGMHSGQKGRHPFFSTDQGVAKLVLKDDPRDLRIVYKLACRLLT
jgi:predicted AlkP superfamily phosphohydrolase/phosphomutase